MSCKLFIVLTTLSIFILSGISCNAPSDQSAKAAADSLQERAITIGTIDSAGVRVINYAHIKLDTLNPLGPEALADEDSARILTQLLTSKLPPIVVDGRKCWVIEGDLLMDKDAIYVYCQRRIARNHNIFKKGIQPKGLTIGGTGPNQTVFEKWPPDYVITYCVLEKSFDKKANYQKIVRMMTTAAQQWMQLCNVRFQYIPQDDGLDPSDDMPEGLTFQVRQQNSNNQFVASSFFPFDPSYRRKLFVDPTYYTSPYDSVGTFRHELGHILGFRHEQIWSQDELCRGEAMVMDGIGAIALGAYDPSSVMHYACGQEGSHKLEFTERDREGAVFIYGAPIAQRH
jgi:hypothetical protein